MRSSTSLVALVASMTTAAAAVHQGFNYGSTNSDGSIRDQQRFQDEFKTAKNLVGASGFNSARLYTMIQGGTTDTPISAIPAAIAEDTTLLLGIWASGGQAVIDSEIAALKAAIATYGTKFTSLVTGLSVGSEDLYRISPTGIAAKSGYGAEPQDLVKYIGQVRTALAGTPLSGVQIGHVDTWNDWVNGSNSAVIEAVDWLGVDAYPYFQSTMPNSINNGPQLFFDAYDATVGAAGGKDVWITETGWPVSGPTYGEAEANVANAKYFWDHVACPSLGKINTYWYTLQDSFPVTPSPSFGVVGSTLSTTPLFDLSCPVGGSSSSAAPSASVSASAKPSTPVGSGVAPSSSLLATGGIGLTPSQGAGNGASVVTSEASSAIATEVSSVASGSSPATTLSVAPTGGAGTGGASGGAGGVGVPTTAANGTIITPTITSSSTTGAFTGAAATAGAGSFVAGALGAVLAAMAAL